MIWKTAIIDKGTDKSHSRLSNANIGGVTLFKESTNNFRRIQNVFNDQTGHGTAIAAIIYKFNAGVNLFSIKLDSSDNTLSEDMLVEGIRYCLDDPLIKIINISLGLPMAEPSTELHHVCREANDAGKIIVASAYNYPDTACYPAFFPFVFGVSCGIVKNYIDYAYLGEGNINILAKGTTQRVAWINNGFRITTGTSFATAHFTGILCKMLEKRDNFTHEEVRSLVAQNSNKEVPKLYYVKKTNTSPIRNLSLDKLDKYGEDVFLAKSKLEFAKKIALFPASDKEIQTIMEFQQECRFHISFFIDYPRKISTSLYAKKNDASEKLITKELSKENFEAFDTIAVGYFLDQYMDTNIIFGINLIKNCLLLNKNFILWDLDVNLFIQELVQKDYPSYSGKIYFSSIEENQFGIVDEFKHLPKVKVPVLAVIGTGSMQGKITTQIRIKKILGERNYNVAHFSSEPQALLLGAEYSFPYGFKSIVRINTDDWVPFLGTCLRGLQKYCSPDIILTGTQGGVLPRQKDNSNIRGNMLATLQYLMGVNPDAVICAINPMDDFELIQQTIQTVINICKAPTLFCVMTPWNRTFPQARDNRMIANFKILSKDDLRLKMAEYSEYLDLPIFDISDPKCEETLVGIIQNYFSGSN